MLVEIRVAVLVTIFGGQLRRDRTFAFGDYQGTRIRQPTQTVSTIPTLAQRDMVRTGDFSALGATIFDPSNIAGGQRLVFAANRIPLTRIDPVAIKLMDLLPQPTSPGATRNVLFNPAGEQRSDQFDVRVDQNVSSPDRLFFKF